MAAEAFRRRLSFVKVGRTPGDATSRREARRWGGRQRARQKSSPALLPSGGNCLAAAILAAHPSCVEVVPYDGVTRVGVGRGEMTARV
jgi:hypothetical protein